MSAIMKMGLSMRKTAETSPFVLFLIMVLVGAQTHNALADAAHFTFPGEALGTANAVSAHGTTIGWEYDPHGPAANDWTARRESSCIGAWVQMSVAGPSPRSGHAMVYDAARGVVLLHGGYGPGGSPADTWTWNGSAWTLAETVGPSPARAHSGIAYDSDHGLVVLFGGELDLSCNNPARFLNDTWTWDGSQWSLATTSGPSPRSQVAMSHDPARGRTVLFGGLNDCGAGLAGTWEWDGTVWTDQQASQPAAHREPRAWFDASAARVRFFGGYNGDYLDDMWEWTGSAWNEIAQAGPVGRQAHALAYDESSSQMLLFAGASAAGTLSDTWLFDGSNWTSFTGASPSPRGGHAMAYDAARAQIVLFGGTGAGGQLGDTWIWSPRPVLTMHPASRLTCASGTATFSVTAAGTGPFSYQWQCLTPAGLSCGDLADGAYADPRTGLMYDVDGATTPTLTISNVVLGDHPDILTFAALVSNDCGTVISDAATLTVTTIPDCADLDNNLIRDDNCVWWDCAAGTCDGVGVIFADMGGPFGACPPDGFANLFDRAHALTCFAGTNPCASLNIDAGGAFGSCLPDGFCNLFDATHALLAFAGTNTCTCPSNPAPVHEPDVVAQASLSVVADRTEARPGSTVRVRAFMDEAIANLQGYQLHLSATGGKAGRLELVDILIEPYPQAAFDPSLAAHEAFNTVNGQMLKGLDAGGVATSSKAYLATFIYQASPDASGTFVVDVLHDQAAGDQTFLVSDFTKKVDVAATTPAVITVK